MSVPRPGPSSSRRISRLVPAYIHCERSHTPRSYMQRCTLVITGALVERTLQPTSPNTWLISGLVIKSPPEPMTGFFVFM